MALYNKSERKLVLANDAAADLKNLAQYAKDKDAYEVISESGIFREIYREKKLAEYLANPEKAAEDRKTELENIEKELFRVYDSEMDTFLKCGVPASEAKARAAAASKVVASSKLAALDAAIPRDIFAKATLADAESKTLKMSKAKLMLN
jgi:F0F1-type ATP synthase delta subunit